MSTKPTAHATLRLTPTERTVATMLALGDKAAAAALLMKLATYRAHMRSVRKKLHVQSRAAAMVVLITSPDAPLLIAVG